MPFDEIQVAVAGGSGYAGGELIRLLLSHPHASLGQVTSESSVGKSVSKLHPNLRRFTDLKFRALDELEPCDVLFVALPHGESSRRIDRLRELAPRIIDLASDFRLSDAASYERWYGRPHARPSLAREFVYGIPELHRDEMREARLVSSAGCNATATILALYPLYKNALADASSTVVEVKVGSSEAGNRAGPASHHPERSGCVRSFMPTGHRHTAEMIQELAFGRTIEIHFSATAIDLVRGVLATCHVFLERDLTERDIWTLYRETYGDEPFIRIVKEREGAYRYPEPKLLAGTNLCDIGFEKDPGSRRLVVVSAIDNLMKGAAGQAVQAFNIMMGYDERTALEFCGLHPV